MDQSAKKDDIGNVTPTGTDNESLDDHSNSPTGSSEHLLTPPEGQIPPQAPGQPPPLLIDQFMREAFAQLVNNPGFLRHVPVTPGDLGGSSHGHGNRTTGSNEHLLPPPSWGQMPQPQQHVPPHPMQQNLFTQQDLEQHLQQLINERMRQQNTYQHIDTIPYVRLPEDYQMYRDPRNFTCSACNHEGPSVVRFEPHDSVYKWPFHFCLCRCIFILFGIAWFFLWPPITPLAITLGALLTVVTLFYCFYPCIFRKFWDACHYCSNCNKCLATYAGSSLDAFNWCPCCCDMWDRVY